MQAGYNIEIMLDGSVIWNSAAALTVGKDAGAWHESLALAGTELGRTYSDGIDYGGCQGYGYCAGYTFAGYDGRLDLGSFANNTSFKVSYLMEVGVAGPVVETGAYAVFGDPLSLGGGGGGGSVHIAAVPEPATSILLGLGLAGLVLARSRKA